MHAYQPDQMEIVSGSKLTCPLGFEPVGVSVFVDSLPEFGQRPMN